jgi:hypothetical protein
MSKMLFEGLEMTIKQLEKLIERAVRLDRLYRVEIVELIN